jgi:hypothetical protein
LRGLGAILLILCQVSNGSCVLVEYCLPLNTDDEDQSVFGRNIEGTLLLGKASKADLLTLCVTILLDVLLGTLEDYATLLLLSL